MSGPVYVNQADVVLRFALTDQAGTAVDLTNATTKSLTLRAPSGVISTKALSVLGAATAGIVQYVTDGDDLNEAGVWSAQVVLTFETGTWPFSVVRFTVAPRLG